MALIDGNIELGHKAFLRGLDLRLYDRTLGAVLCLRELREKIIEADRTFDPNLDDDDDLAEQPRTLAELVNDEAAA